MWYYHIICEYSDKTDSWKTDTVFQWAWSQKLVTDDRITVTIEECEVNWEYKC